MRNIYRLFILFLTLGIISTALAATAPSITSIVISHINDTRAKITFNVNQNNADTIIYYGTSSNNLNKLSDWNNKTTSKREIILDNLNSRTKYYLSIYAYNDGKLTKSPVKSFTTTGGNEPIIAVPAVSDISINNITNSSADITFTVNQSNAKTIIHYGTSSSNLNKLSDWNNDTAETRTIRLDNLNNRTKYYLSIYAYNGSKFSKSTVTSFTTTGEISNLSSNLSADVPEISNVNIDNITNSSVDITFTVNQSNAKTIIHYGTSSSNLNKLSDWNNDTAETRTIRLDNLNNRTKYYLSIYAYNNTDQNYYTNSATRNFTTLESNMSDTGDGGTISEITNKSPSKKVTYTIENQSINFTATFNQIVNVTWFLNDTRVLEEDQIRSSYYFNDTPVIGSWNVTVKWSNKNGSDSYSWTWIVAPRTYQTGNRIWDGTKGMGTTYTWNAYSFAGFYYDLDKDLGTEELTIQNIGRNIDEGDIIYKTSPLEVNFDYSNFGKYQAIGFMADRYFAGYTTNSNISDRKEVSSLGNGQLHKVLLDDEDKRTISVGGTLTLKEGYVLKMTEIDIGAGPGQIWVTLLKDGDEVDSDVLAARETYVYKKKVGSVNNLPIIAVHFDSVFRGREVDAAFIKGLFQISDSYTDIDSGSRYDIMEISSISRDKITMKNEETVSLSEGDTIDLMGNLKIVVADSNTLRFELSIDRTGIDKFEARGTIYPVVTEWTPLNFGLDIGGRSAGLYYDIDEDIGTEKLKINSINGRSIQEGDLVYSTSPQEVKFDYSNFGRYQVIGFMADKYFAGYTTNSIISDRDEKSTIGSGQLHKVLLDDEEKRTISEGGTLTLKEGYVLKMTAVDIGAGTGQIWVTLLKDGNEVDTDVLASGENYIYMPKKVGSVSDVPIIAAHFDSVFRGREVNAAFVKGVFQISESYSKVKTGDDYGIMEVTKTGRDQITMKNKDDIDMSSGDTIELMGNIYFKVADSGSVRFYPFVLVTEEMIANRLLIDVPTKATAGEDIDIKITAGGIPIEGVSVSIEPEIGLIDNQTNGNGILNFTLPTKLKGRYILTATKLGYENANKTIDIEKYIENRLSIDAPANADQFDTISIQITSNDTPVSGVRIIYDNTTIGLTNDEGILNYTLESSGDYIMSASKVGYITAIRDISIRALYSEFRALDISLMPDTIFPEDIIEIRSNVTNIGTKNDSLPIVLTINGAEVDNKTITLSSKEKKEINFTYKAILEKGNYTVEILGQKKLLEVKEKKYNIFIIIAGIITLISAIIIYLLTRKK